MTQIVRSQAGEFRFDQEESGESLRTLSRRGEKESNISHCLSSSRLSVEGVCFCSAEVS